jgi:Ran GTPase-activating protein (RanGAP) involved in mRNA processing and transport
LKIQDKGPTFLRCAVKCIDLLMMVEVDLSDNLLDYEDAKKLAEVIQKDVPLRKLVLQRNNLCKLSAKVLSKALQ